MARLFIDTVFADSFAEVQTLIPYLKHLGFFGAFVHLPLNKKTKIKVLVDDFPLYSRKVIESNDKNEIKRKLSIHRNSTLILGVRTYNLEVLKWAMLDNRVDFLVFNFDILHRLGDSSTLNLLIKHGKFVDFPILPFLKAGFHRAVWFRRWRKICHFGAISGVNFILSSYAHEWFELRAPYDLAGYATILDHPFHRSLECLSSSLKQLISRNLEKLSTGFIAPGVMDVTSEDSYHAKS